MSSASLNLAALLAGAAAGKSLAEIKASHKAPTTSKATKGAKLAPIPLPLPKAYALRKTGYVSWKATARRVEMQVQQCACGAETTVVLGEFYSLENGAAHAVWLRPEGYGIEAPTDLPIEVILRPEPRPVPVCGQCADPSYSLLFDRLCGPKQLELAL
jgi:hypothetical protein